MGFHLIMSNPFSTGANGLFHGGPSGHPGTTWYSSFGMDLGAPVGTTVRAVFDGEVTDFKLPAGTSTEYGHQIWVRAKTTDLVPTAPGGVGIFYTHLQADPGIAIGVTVHRGDPIGSVVSFPGVPVHLHCAIAERRGGTNFGVDLYADFKATINSTTEMNVLFPQDGTAAKVD
ncbi:M23 family metallopeptidase [Streptomyces sp. NPDC127068]|uniref:M23 family metallopeptidase n=1 Tax=Streptomyces sp. NPDC127068 TaxID=3347127 RepID=UPI00366059D6